MDKSANTSRTQPQKVKTRQEVANEYGICVKTLIKRLEDAGIILSPGVIFPNTQLVIYDALGLPPNQIKT